MSTFRIVVVILICLLPGAGRAEDPAASADEVRVQLKWQHQFQFAGYYAAETQGFFRAEGLNVRLIPGGEEHPPIKEVLEGHAHYGISDADLLLAYLENKPVVALAAVFQHSPYILLTRADSGLHTPSDLRGKTLMLSDEQGIVQLKAVFQREGLSLDLVKVVKHSWNIDDIIERRVDAVSAYSTVEPFQLRARGVEPAMIRALDYGVDFYGDTLFTTQTELERHPERTAKLRRAVLRGWEYAFAHPEELIEHIMQLPGVKERGATRELLRFEEDAMRELVLPGLVEMGHMNPGRWEAMARTYQRTGIVAGPVRDIDKFLYRSPAGWASRWAVPLIFASGVLVLGVMVSVLWSLRLRRVVAHRTTELRREIEERKQRDEELRRRAAELAASEQRFRALAQVGPQVVWFTDAAGRAEFFNDRWFDYTGLSCEQSLGWGWIEAVHPEDADRALAEWRRCVSRGEPYEIELRLRHRRGRYRWFLARARPLRAEDKSILRWFGSSTDIEDQKQAQEDLQRTADQLRLALEAGSLGTWFYDPGSGVVIGDERWRKIFGIERPEVDFEDFIDVLHPDDREAVREAARAALESESSKQFDVECRLVHAGDPVRWVIVKGKAYPKPEGSEPQTARFVGTVIDVTERRAAEEALRQSEREFRSFFDNAAVGAVQFGPDGRFVQVNDRYCALTGYSREELLGMSSADLSPPEDRETVAREQQSFLAGEAETYEAVKRYRRKDGEVIWVQLTGTAVPGVYGERLPSAGIVQDVTARRQAEEHLRTARLNAEEAKTAAEQASRAKDDFLAALSHELRTPLTPALAGVMLVRSDPLLPVALRDDLEMIQRNIELEARLIDDLLDVTRIARGKVELTQEPVELMQVVRRAFEVCRRESEDKALRLHLDLGSAPCIVRADAARLQQVFWNLLQNAIKFTGRGGQIRLTGRRNGGWATVEIADNGQGISPEMLPYIFNPFEQGGISITRRFGGLGLGLTITKALVELHGGTIAVESEGKGRGALFRVRLPLHKEERPSEMPGTGEVVSAGKRGSLNILLVEDHSDTARIMSRILKLEGHQVETAGDVATALRLTEERSFDVLLSDLGLPDGSGVDLMRELRRRGNRLPGIALSGFGQEEDIRRTSEAGFAAHLIKPATPESLAEALSAVAERH